MSGAEVRRHDENRVLEVDRVAETIGQLAVFKHLEQDVVNIRVRLLDLIEQHDRVGLTFHTFGELPAFLVADVSGRRTDQLRNRVLFHELGHIEADQRFLAAEEKLGQSARDFGLTDARGSQEQEGTGRTLR